MGQPDTVTEVQAGIVRAAVNGHVAHPDEDFTVERLSVRTMNGDDSADG